MRWLLHRHPIALCVVLFAIVMLALKFWILPGYIDALGTPGFIALMIAAFGWAYWWDRRDARRTTDPD